MSKDTNKSTEQGCKGCKKPLKCNYCTDGKDKNGNNCVICKGIGYR